MILLPLLLLDIKRVRRRELNIARRFDRACVSFLLAREALFLTHVLIFCYLLIDQVLCFSAS